MQNGKKPQTRKSLRLFAFFENDGFLEIRDWEKTGKKISQAYGMMGTQTQEVVMERCTRPDPGQVFEQIRAIATADVTELVSVKDGQLLVADTDKLTPDQRRAISAIEKAPGGIKVKFYDKLKALEILCKCMGLFEPSPDDGQDTKALLRAIDHSTKEVIDTHDLPEIQQATAAGYDMVESAGTGEQGCADL